MLFVSAGLKARFQRAVLPALASKEELQARFKRFKRERARAQRVVLNCPGLDIAHRRLVQSERRYGAEPRLPGYFFKAHDLSHLIFHSFRYKGPIYTGLYIGYKHAGCKSLAVINTICGLRRQLFLETKHRI